MSAPVSRRADVAIIGAGIVGLATALRLLERKPDLAVVVLEKEASVAYHQTGHNSGVLHAGLYYRPGSLKARLCREGKADLEAYCEAHALPLERCGKLVIATRESELPRIEALRERAIANDVPGLEEVGPQRIRELEPHAVGIRGLWSPGTGVVDFGAVARAFARDIVGRGAVIQTLRAAESMVQRGDELVVGTSRGDLVARRVIACAGLQADRVAAMTDTGDQDSPRIVPFRGDYYTLKPEARH
ncbi:MAG TPA: FAD-dependent oxidoreductase, partial [Anaerolineae bacterium]|nr:FAD-dependent oxidoreductase [Anaerolineae bacterium]